MNIKSFKRVIGHIAKQIDRKKVEIAQKSSLIVALEKQYDVISCEIEYETNFVDSSQELHFGFGEFVELAKKNQDQIMVEIKERSAERDALYEELRDMVVEQKKYEHLLNKFLKTLAINEEKLEGELLDNFSRLNKN